jgi:non-specific protein-tyrosine kinase
VQTTAQQVLIAAPSGLARGFLARILGGSGLGVIAVAGGEKALSKAMLRKPDVLVLDLSLSLMSTSRIVKILRANPNTKTIPILFLGEPGQEVPEAEEGLAEVLRRPFLDVDVLARVRDMLARGRRVGTEGIAAQDEGRRKEPEMTKQVVEIADVRPVKVSDPGTAPGKAGWVSPAYNVSREVRLDPSVLEENRCVAYNTESPQVEAYRVLRTRIMHRTRENGGITVMVTSALPGEGKTVTAINLALTFAKAFSQTALLVDADLKRQQIHQVLGFESEKGLGNYLQEGCAVSDLFVWPGIEKLTIISGGKRIEGSSELLGSPAMKALVEDMKVRYPNRYVFFDVPPVLAGADTIAFASLVDHILFVVQAGRSSLADVRKALQMLPKEKILGLVLNRQPDADASKYYGY